MTSLNPRRGKPAFPGHTPEVPVRLQQIEIIDFERSLNDPPEMAEGYVFQYQYECIRWLIPLVLILQFVPFRNI